MTRMEEHLGYNKIKRSTPTSKPVAGGDEGLSCVADGSKEKEVSLVKR